MKYLKLFESFGNIDEICKKYSTENYTINTDGSIDVDEDVNLDYLRLTKLPLKFNKINGYFDCCNNELISLEGSPVEVNGYFDCSYNNRYVCGYSYNNLTSFEYAPRIIRGDFICNDNNIKTFEYFPSFIKDDFICNNNPIYEVWNLFLDISKIELLNDFDIFRDEDTDEPAIFIERLNDFLLTIGKDTVKKVDGYKNI